jgi:hypothetical protein
MIYIVTTIIEKTSKKMQEGLRKSSDYITQLQMASNLRVSKGLDRRMGGEHPF